MTADLPVMIVCEGRAFAPARMRTVSLSGALLFTPLKVPLFANITVSPLIDGKTTADLCACVIRTEPGSVAIEWRDMASPQVIELIALASSDGKGLEVLDPCAA